MADKAGLERRLDDVAQGMMHDPVAEGRRADEAVSYTHLRAHETVLDLVCRLLLEKKTTTTKIPSILHIHNH